MQKPLPKAVYLKDYAVPDYLVHTVTLDIQLDEERTQVNSRLVIRRNPASQVCDAPLVLAGEGLELLGVALNGVDLAAGQYRQSPDALTLPAVPQQGEFTVTLANLINPKANTALEGLYLSGGLLCTQCEAEGFRKITYYLDRPDVMAKFTTTLTADKSRYPVLLSNGNPVASGECDDGRHWVTWVDPFAKPCYLFALVAGQLECVEDRFTTCSGRDIGLKIYVEAHDADKCGHALQALKNAMRWDEEVYGREYDLDGYMIVAVSHFNMGAMENKGLNIFNTQFVLARPDTATDADYEHIEGVIAHEYFHNWTGNRITCRDWFQLSLKEGFTVFRDQAFSGDRSSQAVKRIEAVNLLRTRQFAEDAGPLAHPVRPDAYIEINNFYTVTVYEKGAEVVRMIHTLLGADGFRKGSDVYFDRHDGQAVTCDDFVKAMEDANGVDLTQFRRWYAQAGTPVVKVAQHYDPKAQTLTLTLSQHCPPTPGQPIKQALHIPVKLGLINSEGAAVRCRLRGGGEGSDDVLLELTETEQPFVFEGLAEQPVVSALRGFSAPVKLVQERGLAELAFLLAHDSDPFNRWEAGQSLFVQTVLGLVADVQQGRELTLNPLLADAFRRVLATPWHDLSYFALLLSLPSETYLAEAMAVVDVVAIHAAREFVKRSLAQALQPQLQTVYLNHHKDESGRFDAAAIGRRRLKNTCLGYLVCLDDPALKNWAQQQFKTAKNMTDQLAALAAMVNNPHYARKQSLDNFYQQWRGEALVIDKWFALQAASPMPGTLVTVQALLGHPDFDLKTPNRARALVGSFSQANPLHFHAAGGQGYQFLADQIIALNALNPQIAARLTNALTQWRRFDPNRQALMKAQLQRIIALPDVSRDVYEVAGKSL